MKSVWFAALLLVSAACLAEEADPGSGQAAPRPPAGRCSASRRRA